MTTSSKHGSAASPANMHTDATGGAVKPFNMHTDVTVKRSGSTVTLTGSTEQAGRVGARLPRHVADRIKEVIAQVPAGPVAPPATGRITKCVFDDGAVVGKDAHGDLVITGLAVVTGTATNVLLTIAGNALASLRAQHATL